MKRGKSRKLGISDVSAGSDAGTGMTATNSVAPRTGNVSAGTSTFAMIVLEKQLSKVLPGDRYGYDTIWFSMCDVSCK